MFDWISKWLEKQIVKWLAKQLGVNEDFLKQSLDTIIGFIKEIIDAFGNKEAVKYMKLVNQEGKKVSHENMRQKFKKVLS